MSTPESCTGSCAAEVSKHRSVKALLAQFALALRARRERGRLSQLDTRMLADIGLTPRMAEAEAARPLWDVPNHWRR